MEISDLKALDAELAKESMKGLWVREEQLRRQPTSFGKPKLWKWPKIREGLEAAVRPLPKFWFPEGRRLAP